MAGACHSLPREAELRAPRASGPELSSGRACTALYPAGWQTPSLLACSLSSAFAFLQSFPNTKTNTWGQPPGEEVVSARQRFQQLLS